MTLANLIEAHKVACAAINGEDFASTEAVRTERAIARAFIQHRPTTLDEVRAKAAYASGEALTAADREQVLKSLAA
ncbi:MAG: hypothetical protein KF874_12655 [Rhizobiaceae bacterium]|nr:hypothetical protein [Rhizobiaceae bacterium]